jgi:hypothetical protein
MGKFVIWQTFRSVAMTLRGAVGFGYGESS